MNELQSEKQKLRSEALARRDALDPAYRDMAARAMAKTSDRIGARPGSTVAGFWPIRSEPDIRPLMESLRRHGARLCLPVVIDPATVIFRHYAEGARLVASGFGTLGPEANAIIVDPELILVPLAAFDAKGTRIGYGAGFYDRAIARMRGKGLSPRLIGVGFDCQQIVAIRPETHDVPLDAVLTESGLRSLASHS